MDCLTVADHLWSALTALGTCVLAAVAVFGYFTALGQLAASRSAREDAIRLAKAERATELLAEFGTDDMEYTFGFFDAATDITESREAFNDLYNSLVVAERVEFRALPPDRRKETLKVEALAYLDDDEHSGESSHLRSDRARECKNEIITVANRCERAWVLLDKNVVDPDIFLADQAYNIASTYFIAQDALADLCKEEHFDFDDFRSLAMRARDFLKDTALGKDFVGADFPPLPQYDPTGR